MERSKLMSLILAASAIGLSPSCNDNDTQNEAKTKDLRSEQSYSGLEKLTNSLDYRFDSIESVPSPFDTMYSSTGDFNYSDLTDGDALIVMKSAPWCGPCQMQKKVAMKVLDEAERSGKDFELLIYDGEIFSPGGERKPLIDEKDPHSRVSYYPEIDYYIDTDGDGKKERISSMQIVSLSELPNLIGKETIEENKSIDEDKISINYDPISDAPFILDAIARNKDIEFVADEKNEVYGFRITTLFDDEGIVSVLSSDSGVFSSPLRELVDEQSNSLKGKKIVMQMSESYKGVFNYINEQDKEQFEGYKKRRGFVGRSSGMVDLEKILNGDSISTDVSNGTYEVHFMTEYVSKILPSLPAELQGDAQDFLEDAREKLRLGMSGDTRYVEALYTGAKNWELKIPSETDFENRMDVIMNNFNGNHENYGVVRDKLQESRETLERIANDGDVDLIYPASDIETDDFYEGFDVNAVIRGANMADIELAYKNMKEIQNKIGDNAEYRIFMMPFTDSSIFPDAGNAQISYQIFTGGRDYSSMLLTRDGRWVPRDQGDWRFLNPAKVYHEDFNEEAVRAISEMN